MPLAEYERRRRDANTRLLALDRQEHDLARDAERQGATAGLAVHAEAFCRRVREGLADADFDRKRALLELLVDRVIVSDGAVEIRYVVPTGPDGEREPFWRLRTDYRGRDWALEAGDRGLAARAYGRASRDRGGGG
ncbi:MAG: recombinase family protein, partial [Chloroflexi bacterium]|nr:recombinase family protein [Chloroflexota bacterium]